jgi:hypothetical protein
MRAFMAPETAIALILLFVLLFSAGIGLVVHSMLSGGGIEVSESLDGFIMIGSGMQCLAYLEWRTRDR